VLRSVLTKPYTIHFEDVVPVDPGKGDALVRLTMTGICGSDVHWFKKGRPDDSPLTIGHEGIGIIAKTGTDVDPKRIGERIVIEPNIPCHHCPECRSGRGYVCRNKRIIGVTENGCFSEYVVVPQDFAHRLPTSITNEDAVTIEPAAVALSALSRSLAKPGDPVLIIGLGAIGLLVNHIALALGYKVFVVEPVRSKLNAAAREGAIPVVSDGSEAEVIANIAAICGKEEVVSVFECAGSEKTATLAIAAASQGAEVVLLGLSDKPATFIPINTSKKGIQLNFSLIYNHPADFRRVIQLVDKGIIHPGSIISKYFLLNELKQALETATKGSESKIVVNIKS
jgi:L-iditol 2-dehydrogenase